MPNNSTSGFALLKNKHVSPPKKWVKNISTISSQGCIRVDVGGVLGDPLCECGSLLSPINPCVTSSPLLLGLPTHSPRCLKKKSTIFTVCIGQRITYYIECHCSVSMVYKFHNSLRWTSWYFQPKCHHLSQNWKQDVRDFFPWRLKTYVHLINKYLDK